MSTDQESYPFFVNRTEMTDTSLPLDINKGSPAYKAYFYQVHQQAIRRHLDTFCINLHVCEYWLSLSEDAKPEVVETISRAVNFDNDRDLSDKEQVHRVASLASAVVIMELRRGKRRGKTTAGKKTKFQKSSGHCLLRTALINAGDCSKVDDSSS
ncbi:hypothetical protein CPB84DRAFT_1042634 [Gymnopilus junonius]|uniref:Uncharacterized protein n=1 Tax=Gymnopilus junonius TaxID=109634 RepID=A0A9P5NQB0_GYMJU|nr:hypothetical protein CPB84DRAFT_1042634 [Gymnopilus junonius]